MLSGRSRQVKYGSTPSPEGAAGAQGSNVVILCFAGWCNILISQNKRKRGTIRAVVMIELGYFH